MPAAVQLTVQPGDDLYRIAARYYGDANGWTIIAFANPALGGDPLINAEQVITIPPYSSIRANGGILYPTAGSGG